jgi:hypothetical protein
MPSREASGTAPARCVDLPDDPLANDAATFRHIDDPDKLMARDARKIGITSQDFQVCVADANQRGTNASLARTGIGQIEAICQLDLPAVRRTPVDN